MGISGIGSSLSNQYSSASLTNRKSKENSAYQATKETKINLYLGADGEMPLTAVGYPNGVSVSVFRPKDGSTICPVKYWDETGLEQETTVDVSKVDPQNASYIEMLAYSGYTDSMGYTSNAESNFNYASAGVNADRTYDSSNLNTKYDFQSLVKESMDLMFKTSYMDAYLSFKKYYDYLSSK